MQLFFELVALCERNSERIRDQSIILLLGSTGAGKSTLIQYLFGAIMARIHGDHIQAAEPIDPRLREFVSSSAMSSVTRYINPLKMTFIN